MSSPWEQDGESPLAQRSSLDSNSPRSEARAQGTHGGLVSVPELVDRIYRLKQGDIPLSVEAAWHGEIHRRIADLERGRVRGVPLEETLAKVRAIVDP